MAQYVSRAGQKLEHALVAFGLEVTGNNCADLGCSTGGFTDCLLQRGATRVFAVDTGYGVLDYKLRKNPRVTVLERTNAMHVRLPEPVDLVTIDVAWTRQKNILPSACRLLKTTGQIISLIKPHYEADVAILRAGVLPGEEIDQVLVSVSADVEQAGLQILNKVQSPIKGAKGNTEFLWLLKAI